MIESLIADLRFACRWLARSPGFALVAIASLAIGIGFNSALFTVVDALLLRPLPVARPAELVDVYTVGPGAGARVGTTSYPDYVDLRATTDTFADVLAYSPMFAPLNLGDRSRLVLGEVVTGNYFEVLGVTVAAGRPLLPADDAAGAPRVAVISHGYWMREFGGAPDAVGRTLRLRGVPYTVVGIAPASFSGMVPLVSPELWVPMSAAAEVEPVGLHDVVPSPTGTTRLDRRGDRWLFVRGRLRPGVTAPQAEASLAAGMAGLAQAFPETNRGRTVRAVASAGVRLHPSADAMIAPLATGLMAVVGLVLLIACANVASMLLARAAGRQREIAVRLAIGASRARLVRQLVTETFVLASAGAVAGLVLAWWATRAVASLSLPVAIPVAFDLAIGSRVFLFTAATTCVAALVAGLAPAVRASRPDITPQLRGDVPGAAGRWSMRDALVAGQVAVTAFLLVIGALLTRSLIAAETANVGFDTTRLAVVAADPAMARDDDAQARRFWDDAVRLVGALPGVEHVALASRVPFSVNFNRWDLWVPGRHGITDPADTIDVTTVSPGYFATLGIPVLEGRGFTDADGPDTPRVAVVNETMARRYWPGQDAVGRTFRSRNATGPEFQVIGVVADHKVSTVGEPPTPLVHVARAQRPGSFACLVVRTRGDAAATLGLVRAELLALEPNLVFIESQTMEDEVATTLFPVRAGAWVVSLVGAAAMLLAAAGLYGVIAFAVARRTREIGIRMALGARRWDVVALVVRQGLVVAAVGLAGGLVAAILVARALTRALYGVTAGDPVSWLAGVALVGAVAGVAHLVPAVRACRIVPTEALRAD